MKGPVNFVFAIIWFAIGLSTLGLLKDCTMVMAGHAVQSQRHEVLSLGNWNRKINKPVR